MQDLIAVAIIAVICLALTIREARLRWRIKALEASLFQALGRVARVDESNRIMGDKLKQIAKERQAELEGMGELAEGPIPNNKMFISDCESVQVYDIPHGHTLDDKLTTRKEVHVKTRDGAETLLFCYMGPVENQEISG